MSDLSAWNYGEALRRERERRGWTREDLAQHIGGAVPSIDRWENGRGKPGPSMLKELIRLFGPVETWEKSLRIWHVPFLRNLYFTGRERILTQLHDVLTKQSFVAITQKRAISGLGGIGKTQTALQYAYRYADEYDAVLWVQADSRETLLSQFAGLASVLRLPEQTETDQNRVAEAVKRWLETQAEWVWLLILDNADDPSLVSKWLPTRGGAILLTTRSHGVGKHIRPIELNTFSLEEGREFLLKRLARLEEPAPAVSEAERQAAEELCRVLDGLPLALDQAAAYIEEKACSLAEYVSRYQHQQATLLSYLSRMDLHEYPYSVATTWLLSFQQVQQANPQAAELLRLCTFLHPDAIPEEALLQVAATGDAAVQAEKQGSLLQDSIALWLRYSLVQYQAKMKTITIHRLVQAVIWDGMQEQERIHGAERIVAALNALFPDFTPDAPLEVWNQCERLWQHVLACTAAYIPQKPALALASLLSKTAHYLRERAQYEQAEALYQRALHVLEQVLEPGHLEFAPPLHKLAILYRQQGKYEQAEPLLQRVLQIREQALGCDHLEVATSLVSLAILFFEQGKYEQAEPLFLRALRIREQALGPEHRDVATPLNGLANLYTEQGKYEQAEPLFQRTLRIREQALGADNPSVASPLNNLGELSRLQGQYAQSEFFHQRALQIWKQALGSEHPDVAHALNGLGDLFRLQDKYEQAEAFYQSAIQIWKQGLGPEHPNVASALNGLGSLYIEHGKYAQAEPLLQQSLHIFEQALGATHPSVAAPLNGLANLALAQGDDEQAEPLFQRALAIRRSQRGNHHPETAESLHDLACFYELHNQPEQALAFYREAWTIREQRLGPEHPHTSATHDCIARLLQQSGQAEEENAL